MSSLGLESKSKEMEASNQAADLIIGTGHPDKGDWHSRVNIGEFVASSVKDGIYADTLAKTFISTIYHDWEEGYRHKIAQEIGTEKNNIKNNLMGDLRIIRNCIVHESSIITNEHKKIKELNWEIKEGFLIITRSMFSSLMNQINTMAVEVVNK